MRWLLLVLWLVAGCGGKSPKVEALGLHDPRLPVEARRGLADAEDEVAVAGARLDDAEHALHGRELWGDELVERARALEAGSAQASELTRGFRDLAKLRVELARREVRAVRKQLDLAQARLVRTRAETAMRHDIDVYDLEPLDEWVASAQDDVSATQRVVEETRAEVDAAEDAVWRALARYVAAGGSTDGLWAAPNPLPEAR